MQIRPGDLNDRRIIELIQTHVNRARSATAAGSAHALDLMGLRTPDVQFWAAWEGNLPVAIGALKRLSADHGEIKSMYVDETARRTGVGGAMLRHIKETALKDGMTRLSLETGSWTYFAPARSFYVIHGFVECGPFADYVPDPNSIFMTIDLT